ncbi:MAG: ankyrin repeat domain-containing protein [Desulfobacterales bacterium]|nr:ankyrin repeat domain-containing protein [Desulfobacterales bacterium]
MAKKITVSQALAAIWVISCCFIGTYAGAENISLNFQESSCTASLEKVPLRIVIDKLRRETGIWVKAPEYLLDERVSVKFENLSIQEGLKRIFRTMNHSLLFDLDSHLIGAFVFSSANRLARTIYSTELNEQMVSAAFEGNTTDVMALLAQGADVNAEGAYSGWTPLMLAAKKGNTQLVRLLIAHGADLDAKSRGRSRTALMEAARNRKIDTLKVLLAANPDVDAVDWEGYTVLMFAAVSGQLDMVSALIALEADVNVKNKVGSSALMMASGYPEVQKILKDAGAEE